MGTDEENVSQAESKTSADTISVKEQISELLAKKEKGKITEAEDVKSGTVEPEVFKKYFRKFGGKAMFWVLLAQTFRYVLWLGENIWLADWSDRKRASFY